MSKRKRGNSEGEVSSVVEVPKIHKVTRWMLVAFDNEELETHVVFVGANNRAPLEKLVEWISKQSEENVIDLELLQCQVTYIDETTIERVVVFGYWRRQDLTITGVCDERLDESTFKKARDMAIRDIIMDDEKKELSKDEESELMGEEGIMEIDIYNHPYKSLEIDYLCRRMEIDPKELTAKAIRYGLIQNSSTDDEE